MYDSFLGRGVVDAPMKVVGDFVSDIKLASLWDNTLVVSLKVLHFLNHISLYTCSSGCTICESDTQITRPHGFY